MEARRRGYRQQEAAPPERGHPLANLTRSMSQPATEPASAPALRHIPRRYLALGLIVVAICLLGALVLVRDNSGPSTSSTVETFSPAPSSLVSTMASVPASVYDTVGVELAGQPGARRRSRPGAAARRCGWPRSTAGRPSRSSSSTAPSSRPTPPPSAGRWSWPSRASAPSTSSGSCSRARRTAFANLSTFTFWNVSYTSKYVDPRVRRALQLAEPDGGALSQPADARRPAGRRRSPATAPSPTRSPLLDVANRYVLNGASFAPGVLAGLSQEPDRRRPRPRRPAR